MRQPDVTMPALGVRVTATDTIDRSRWGCPESASMGKGRLTKGVWIAVLVPLFGATVLPTQVQWLACHFSGAAMALSSCCPEQQVAGPETPAKLRGETCCVLKTVDLQKVLGERSADGALPRLLELPAKISSMVALGSTDLTVRFRPVGPPPLGPPLVLLKRSFRI